LLVKGPPPLWKAHPLLVKESPPLWKAYPLLVKESPPLWKAYPLLAKGPLARVCSTTFQQGCRLVAVGAAVRGGAPHPQGGTTPCRGNYRPMLMVVTPHVLGEGAWGV
ncbi:MAG: hypothetical protein FWB81_07270, partial [Cystobacterineae bacterium]|nr:hypothetical protein [Cystobacterineae bacterium]